MALGTAAALPVWAGLIAWGAFFAAGGKTTGLIKTLASNLSGVLWAWIALTLSAQFGGGVPILSALVGVAAFGMVMQSRIPQLSFIPEAFLGAATAVSVVVGASGTWVNTIIALVAGAVLGFLSELIAGKLAKPAAA